MPKNAKLFRVLSRKPNKHNPRERGKDERPSAHKRGYNAKWRKARLVHLAENPQCKGCGKVEGSVSFHVDHIIDHNGDYELFWDPENWQTLCPACHNKKGNSQQSQEFDPVRYVVTGAPGSGKSSYVQTHASPHSIVWDYDSILNSMTERPGKHHIDMMERLRKTFIDWVTSCQPSGEIWMITANQSKAEYYAKVMNAKLITGTDVQKWKAK